MTPLWHRSPRGVDEPERPDRLSAYLASPGHFTIVALFSDMVVGQCAAVIHRHPDKVSELYIDEVGVAPAFQRQGIATRMLDAMFGLGREPGNVAARALYEAGKEPHGEAEEFVIYVYELRG
jgi:ribosomal protein S18 acetylase RimI-like enzyme